MFKHTIGTRGFSLVELMVSVLVASIAFGALVPLFVGAQRKAVSDQMRITALNIAQDRIEKIRALKYDDIVADSAHPASSPNLYNASYMGGQFGPTYTAPSGSHTNKVFTVDYTVTSVGAGLTAYKKVCVDVYWTAPPRPVKHARLTTMISKQYAGPQITNLALSPLNVSGEVTGKPVVLTATIAPEDIASMAANGSLKGKVMFYVFSAVNGTQIASYTVNTGDAGNTGAGTYTASWNASGAEDGDYSFRAQAYDNSSAVTPNPGNVWQRTTGVILSAAPHKVSGLTATPGDGRATLNWTACTASDFDHYEVWQGTSSGAETNLGLSHLTANSYITTGLNNDDTYYFVVYAMDTDGNKSPVSDEVSVVPTALPGVNRPTTPGAFAVAASYNTAVLTWTASTQDGTSALAGYYIYRDGATTPFANVAAGAMTWTDTIGWTATHTYLLRAFNAAGRRSVSTATLSVTTGAATKHNLTVNNTNTSSAITVWVQSTTTGLWWTGNVNPSYSFTSKPSGFSISKKKSTVWYQLPYDTYTVSTAKLSQTLNPATTPSVSFNQ
jgi:prepilin-type N-terminal cleavage/methylation domain-containing protein